MHTKPTNYGDIQTARSPHKPCDNTGRVYTAGLTDSKGDYISFLLFPQNEGSEPK
jgi:hypothetical protein